MKQSLFEEKKYFRDILLVMGLLTGFIFIVTFSSVYVSDAINAGTVCGCVIPVPVMIVVLSSLGLFVGILTYYVLGIRYMRAKEKLSTDIELTLNFLDNDERSIIKALIDNKSSLKQRKIEELTGMNKVKVHRLIKKLINKRIIHKTSDGKTNIIELEDNLSKLFKR